MVTFMMHFIDSEIVNDRSSTAKHGRTGRVLLPLPTAEWFIGNLEINRESIGLVSVDAFAANRQEAGIGLRHSESAYYDSSQKCGGTPDLRGGAKREWINGISGRANVFRPQVAPNGQAICRNGDTALAKYRYRSAS